MSDQGNIKVIFTCGHSWMQGRPPVEDPCHPEGCLCLRCSPTDEKLMDGSCINCREGKLLIVAERFIAAIRSLLRVKKMDIKYRREFLVAMYTEKRRALKDAHSSRTAAYRERGERIPEDICKSQTRSMAAMKDCYLDALSTIEDLRRQYRIPIKRAKPESLPSLQAPSQPMK